MNGFGPPFSNREMIEKLKEPKPKTLKEVPSYLKKIIGGFFSRLFYIVKLVWEARPSLLFLMVFMAIFDGIMPVVGSLISAHLLNQLYIVLTHLETLGEPAAFSIILNPLLLQFGFLFFRSLVSNINNIINRTSSEIVTNHIKLKIMNKAKELDISSFDMPDFYERLENANREAGVRPIHVLNSTFSIVSVIISIVSYIIILSAVSWWASLVTIAFAVPSAIITFKYRRKNFMYMRRNSKERRQLSYYSDLTINKNTVKEVRLFDLNDTFVDKYNEVFDKYYDGHRKLITAEGIWHILLSFLSTGINCLLFLFIANGVRIGTIAEIGQYSLYSGALNSISGGINTLISTSSTIYEGTLFIENMIIFMNEKKRIVPLDKSNPEPVKRGNGHTIEFRNVSFAYPGTDVKVLKNVNFKLDPGDTAVLVGLNGAGKTTLIKLLTRLYDPTEGEIYFDGKDIRSYDPADLYKVFGIIFQDFGKYAFTAGENIAFGEIYREMDEKAIKHAASQSGADDFIEKLPDKYDTPLMRMFEQSGLDLSIGQWQKLSIARAFYRNSDILILDEPTASLDPMAEQEIYNQFDELSKDKTTVFVSHRLSSATTADKIIVLKYGEIIEMGRHDELMAAKGEYYTLFSTQAKRYLSPDADPAEEAEAPIEKFPPRERHRRPRYEI
ncbi:MAG: ABC transporter ATP-binding protein [Ruminococcaceae bacterium]|nr:ABC transporter ATP-binding protein [Oscillospiraceae bacterium]